MPNTYFDSDLTGEQIEAALKAIDGVVTPENNGKVLVVENGKIAAKSASAWTDTPVLEPLSVTANGDYTPGAGVDGYNSVHVAVPGAGNIQPLSVTENGTYSPPSGVDGYAPVTVNVSGGGGTSLIDGESFLTSQIDFSSETMVFCPLSTDSDGSLLATGGLTIPVYAGENNSDRTIYIVSMCTGNNNDYNRILSSVYAHNTRNEQFFFVYQGNRIAYSSYADDTVISDSNPYIKHVYAISIDGANLIARFFLDGVFLAEKTIYNNGTMIYFGGNDNQNMIGNIYFAAFVKGFQSNDKVIANCNALKTHYGIS